MADTGCEQRAERCESRPPSENRTDRSEEDIYDQRRSDGDMADTECGRRESGTISEPQSSTVVSPQISAGGFWSDAIWLPCRDGKARRTQPGLFPLAHGIPGRVAQLRGLGNAIVPQAAATFIKTFLQAKQEIA
jgi:DNA (cytosine-5)-methyltransferase 1